MASSLDTLRSLLKIIGCESDTHCAEIELGKDCFFHQL